MRACCSRLDFNNASEDGLKQLAQTCDPAKFGLNQEHVLDEAYRSAGKLDLSEFSIGFDPESSRIMDAIREVLLSGHETAGLGIRWELYKLNVYGPGQFFKAHKDTPRDDTMFASLVVILPTVHEGGALRFEHQDRTFVFDSAAAVAKSPPSSVAFTAFYSDINHEVTPVTSGYRVTLTYNLFFLDVAPAMSIPFVSPQEDAMRAAIDALLHEDEFLPKGGYIGFALRHEYALQPMQKTSTLERFLKGSDAVLAKASQSLGLQTKVWMAFTDQNGPWGQWVRVLSPIRPEPGKGQFEEGIMGVLRKRYGAKLLDSTGDYNSVGPDITVHWATPMEAMPAHRFSTSYMAYGNEPSLVRIYGSLCLLIQVGPNGDRVSGEPEPPSQKEEDKSSKRKTGGRTVTTRRK
ncbi:hypothetical protein BDW22DRAFT_1322352 [Trametopsis cervina]|nr:hypothetical protein BDW22DRAFT_1322352 [Trametopsis cervina]